MKIITLNIRGGGPNKSSKQEIDNDVKTMSKEIKGYLKDFRNC